MEQYTPSRSARRFTEDVQMRRWAWLATVLLGVGFTMPAGAVVLCKNKRGALFTRESCKKKETAVDPSTFGAARAYGCSTPPDELTAAPCQGRPAKNIVDIVASTVQPGYTCFVLDPSIDADSAVVVASLNDHASSGDGVNALVLAQAVASYEGCPHNSVVVATGRNTAPDLDFEPAILGVNIVVQ